MILIRALKVIAIVSLQNRTKPPPLASLGTTNMFSNCIFHFTSLSLVLSAHVSAINTTEGYLARTMSASSFSVHGFPSPRQFQIKQLIAIDRVDTQPPPLKKKNSHHPLKPIYACLVTLDDHHRLSYHKLFFLPCSFHHPCTCLIFSSPSGTCFFRSGGVNFFVGQIVHAHGQALNLLTCIC